MNQSAQAASFQPRLVAARELATSGQVLQAEAAYNGILKEWPESIEAATALARFAMDRGDAMRASRLLERARLQAPDEPQLAVNLGFAYAASGRPAAARTLLEQTVERAPAFAQAWLHLGQLRDAMGDARGADRAWFQAIKRAQSRGEWMDERSTPPWLLQPVLQAMARVATGRRQLFFAAFEALRQQHGPDALKRVDRALTGYLREWEAVPPDARQRPKFFYFPDIPATPYLDPYLQPWMQRLVDAYPAIRAEALAVMAQPEQLRSFMTFKDGDRVQDYVSGDGPRPSWDAFFFYRHGKRYDENHLRCPQTSALLESIELCRIRDQAPEVCFSVLTPGSHIMPHHGVTNTRVVVHLPLVVPANCALNIVGGDPHHWQEGVPMMFDDTFQHEAWNRSDSTRVILLMDCWNPHLTDVERLAVKQLVESISDFEGEAKVG